VKTILALIAVAMAAFISSVVVATTSTGRGVAWSDVAGGFIAAAVAALLTSLALHGRRRSPSGHRHDKGGTMRIPTSKKALVLFTAVVAAGASAAIALSAAPPQTIVDTTAVHLRVVRQTLDNYDSGWHIHPGLVFVKVHEGSLQFYEDGCTAKTVNAGDFTVEPPYEPVRVKATHAVETVTFLLNAADPVLVPLSAYSPGHNPCPSLP